MAAEGATVAIAITCDVSDEAQMAAAVKRTASELGGIYGVPANAGTVGRGWIHETMLEDRHAVLDVNLEPNSQTKKSS